MYCAAVCEGVGVLRHPDVPPGPTERQRRHSAAHGGPLGLRGDHPGAARERGERRHLQQEQRVAAAVRAQPQGELSGTELLQVIRTLSCFVAEFWLKGPVCNIQNYLQERNGKIFVHVLSLIKSLKLDCFSFYSLIKTFIFSPERGCALGLVIYPDITAGMKKKVMSSWTSENKE